MNYEIPYSLIESIQSEWDELTEEEITTTIAEYLSGPRVVEKRFVPLPPSAPIWQDEQYWIDLFNC